MATKEIIFTNRGGTDLKDLFRSLRQEAERIDKVFSSKLGPNARKAGRQISRSAKAAAKDWTAAKRPLSDVAILALRVAQDQKLALKRTAVAAKGAARSRVRSAKWAADAERRSHRDTARAAKRAAREAMAASRKASNARIRAIKRESAMQRQQARFERRIANRRQTQAFTHARRLARHRRGQRSLFFDYAMGARRRGGGLLRVAAGALGLSGAAIAAGGTYAVGSAARQGIALSDTARRLSRKGGGAVGAEDLRKSFQRTALDVRGVRAMDVARGTEAFVTKTGDVGAAQRFQRTFAEVGLATGTDIEEIAGAAADLFEKFDVRTVEEMSSAMATLAIQGKRGAFELEDAAKQFPKIAAAASKFGLRGTAGLATLGGLTQIARRATPGGEEAATSVEQLFAQLIKKSDVIAKKTKTNVFKDMKTKRETNNLTDVLIGTVAGSGGNLKTLEDIFGTRGSRAISPLVTEYNRARGAATGTDAARDLAGRKALRDMIESATDSTGALAEIQRDLASAQQDASSKITAAWENFVIQISNKALPGMLSALEQFSAFVDQTNFEGLGQAISDLASVVVAAARAIGLIAPKSKKERELEAMEGSNAATLKGNKARNAKMMLEGTIAGRTKFEGGKLIPGEATSEELSTMKVLDEAIKLADEEVSKTSAQAGLARRFDSNPSTFLGLEHGDIRNQVATSPLGQYLVPGTAAGGLGQGGAIEEIANEALRTLAMRAKGVEADLDNMSAGIKMVNEAMQKLGQPSLFGGL